MECQAYMVYVCVRCSGEGKSSACQESREGPQGLFTWSGHRKYRKSPLTPAFVYISAVPPVVKERRANLPCRQGRK